jgi:hypothetical protein
VPRRSSPWLFWSLLALFWIPVTAGLALQAAVGGRSLAAVDVLRDESWRIAIGFFPSVGAVIVARERRNVVG